jgi:transposase
MTERYVGIDLHRRRSVIYAIDRDGNEVSCVRIFNEPDRFVAAVAAAVNGSDAEVVLESGYGWYWAVDLLQAEGYRVHLSHPTGNNWGHRRVKNDERDARDLADLCRLGRLAEAWIAPPEVRELRELVRYRHRLMQLRTGLKAQVHAVMAKEGVLPEHQDLFRSIGGRRQLDELMLSETFLVRLESLRDLIELYDREILMLDHTIHAGLKDDPRYRLIQQLNGIGPVIAAILIAEIGDVSRFRSPDALCSWAGLTPRHFESDLTVHRGPIIKMGSPLVRGAIQEGIARYKGDSKLRADFARIAARRGKHKARIAVARKLLTLVYYGLRDGEIRALAKAA